MKKISKIIAMVLSVAFALALITACGGGGTPQPAPGGSAAAGGSGTAGSGGASGSATPAVVYGEYTGPEMTLEVNLSSSLANAAYLGDAFDRITARTDGKVKFNITEYSGLLDTASALEGLGTGVADISDLTLSNYPESFVYTTQMCAQPFMGFKDIDSANDIIREVIIKNPDDIMTQEFTSQNVKPLMTAAVFGTSLFLAKDTPIAAPTDLKGLKIMTDDQVLSQFINEQSGAAMQLDIMNMGSNMRNGVADGVFIAQNVGEIFGADEETKALYTFPVDLSTHIKTTSINLDRWNSFDDTLKNIFNEELGDDMYKEYIDWVDMMEAKRHDKFDANTDMHQYILPEDQIPAWQSAIKPFTDAQLAELAPTHPDLDKANQIWRDAIDSYYASH
ncbi:MAG: hypothetical protein IKF90_06925 [Parasporobacterium sp.]|nr:hypothetical protein [Parasporobacterium sp.]